MRQAIGAVKKKEMCLLNATKAFNFPRPTLTDYVKTNDILKNFPSIPMSLKSQIFLPMQEIRKLPVRKITLTKAPWYHQMILCLCLASMNLCLLHLTEEDVDDQLPS
jgi:hypothetical protein